ncbi:MAG TPA: Zn-ribbon domain-containing OB-fold protein [Novosphingobium sp.]|nr:Zn-ribbon domain-containing OB-fold protein [Novosphingobium sp.]
MTDSTDSLFLIERAAPKTLSISAPFWEGTREKKLMLQYCLDSGQYQFYPRPVSIFTGSRNLEWREVSGEGEVFTYTIARIGRGHLEGVTPFIVATIRLDEDVTIMSNVIDCDLDRIAIGLRVEPVWAPLPDGTHLLLFRPK